MDIYVSSLDAAHGAVMQHRPATLISFVDTISPKPYFTQYTERNHFILNFNDSRPLNDINSIQHRLECANLLLYLSNHDMRYGLLIHCVLGISRSTAAAYIALNLHTHGRELEIAQYLRSKIPYALPNLNLIALADKLLGRDGRMIAAIESLPPPDMNDSGGYKIVSTDFI